MKRTMGPTEWALLVTLSALWGGSFFFSKVALRELSPLTVVLGRVGLAAVALNALVLLTGGRMPRSPRLWAAFLAMGVLNNLIPFSLIFWGQTRIASGLAAILNATTPLFAVIVAHLLTRDERLSINRLLGVCCGVVGVAIMIGPELLRGVGAQVVAEIAVLGAALSYAFAGVFGRRFRGLPSLVTATGQVTATTAMMLPLALLADRPWRLAPPATATWGALLGLALLSTAVAYIIYFRLLAAAGATNLLLVTLLIPVSALLLGTLILGERLDGRVFAGMAAIGLGMAAIDGRPFALLRDRASPDQSARAPAPAADGYDIEDRLPHGRGTIMSDSMTATTSTTAASVIPTPFASDERRWVVVVNRDRSAADSFLYGVRTTGIYCRPGCASRLPRREHVAFFADRTEAERAGFRPCKRCRPETATAETRAAAAVAAACRRIDEAERPPSLAELAAAVGLSPSHFHRLVRRAVGLTPKGYAAARRRQQVREGLSVGESVTGAIYGAGYGSGSRFYGGDAAALGRPPAPYRAGGAGETIRWGVGRSSLGAVLVAATARGVCAVDLVERGRERAELGDALRRRFPRAALVEDPTFAETVERVVALVEAPAAAVTDRRGEIPLVVRGTAFQERVWAALRAIPAGETASYAEVAARIGRPGAARAVAGACAANPVAVAVPCHRVVRGDGGLGGYRWGEARKRALLAREAEPRRRAAGEA